MIVETNHFLGYPDRISVPAGERVRFQLSSKAGKVDVAVVRLRCADADATGPGLKYEVMPSAIDGIRDCPHQPVHAGSYGLVPADPRLTPRRQWTIGCHAWPTRLANGPRVLMARWSPGREAGYALEVSAGRGLVLRLGTRGGKAAEFAADIPVDEHFWYWFGASFDLETGEIVLQQWRLADGAHAECRREVRFSHHADWAVDGDGPLIIAARPKAGGAAFAGHFDGKIEAPRILARVADARDMIAFAGRERPGIQDPDLVGLWDFSIGIDTLDIRDLSANRLHGRLHQLPRRAVTGVHWTGAIHDWRLAPEEYGAIHFHSDDLYDCGWTPVLELDVPSDWRSGIYALRLRPAGPVETMEPGAGVESFVTFFVTPAAGARREKLAVIASVASYVAYANNALRLYHVHFESLMEALLLLTMDDVYLQEHPEIAQSTYDTHIDGSGRAYSSWLRPILNMRPRANPFNLVTDTHFIDWLEEKGIPYDLITDIEVDRQGARALEPYRAVCTLSHPEYYSASMMNALMAYQNAGGRHFCLGANGFYWRCAFHPDAPAALEVRRGISGTRTWESQPGEVHLAGTGEPGSLWRHSGFAPQKLIGAGFAAMLYDRPGYFMRTEASDDPRVAFIVDGIAHEERIGDFGVRIGGAVGIEIDRYDRELGSPLHAVVVATSHGLGPGALPSPEEFRTMVRGLDGEQNALVRADMVFFETMNGGAVFTTGSISYVLSLSHNGYDNNVSRLTENVLRRFLDPEPFRLPGAAELAPVAELT